MSHERINGKLAVILFDCRIQIAYHFALYWTNGFWLCGSVFFYKPSFGSTPHFQRSVAIKLAVRYIYLAYRPISNSVGRQNRLSENIE